MKLSCLTEQEIENHVGKIAHLSCKLRRAYAKLNPNELRTKIFLRQECLILNVWTILRQKERSDLITPDWLWYDDSAIESLDPSFSERINGHKFQFILECFLEGRVQTLEIMNRHITLFHS